MLTAKLISDKTRNPMQGDVYEPQSSECTPIDRTFVFGFVIVMTIVGITLYFALYYRHY